MSLTKGRLCGKRKTIGKEYDMQEKHWKRRALSVGMAAFVTASLCLNLGAASADEGISEGNLLLFNTAEDAQEVQENFQEGNLLLYHSDPSENLDDGGTDVETNPDGSILDPDALGEIDDSGEWVGDVELGEETLPETTPSEPETVLSTGRLMGNEVKLRAQPSTSAEIVILLNEGATLQITGKEGAWYKVQFGIVNGYVHKDYVFEVSETGLNGTILRDGINLRDGSSLSANVITTLAAGTGVQVTDYQSGWYKVNYSGQSGFVRKDCITVTGAFTGETATRMLKSGMSGEAVLKAQTELQKRGFFVGTPTGDYGSKTTKAVQDFQTAAKVEADGVLGEQTLALLYGDNDIKATISQASQVKGRVQLIEWSKVNSMIPRGAEYKIIDVRTGISWNERRLGGWLHIDTEPLTKEDTAKMKRVYGGSWSWNRRAVWVVYDGTVFAASINGMPHAGQAISGNDFDGHHCIHFYKSKGHGSRKQCPKHQACVLAAYKAGQ